MKKLCKVFSCVCGLLAISSTFSVNVFAGPVVRGFDIETGIYVSTNKPYNPRGYDMDGYKIKYIPDANNPWEDDDSAYGAFRSGNAVFLRDGKYDFENGYTRRGFNCNWIHRDTGTLYDPDGYDVNGFDRNGIHRVTHTKWSPYNFDCRGFRVDGYNVYTLSYRAPDGRYR